MAYDPLCPVPAALLSPPLPAWSRGAGPADAPEAAAFRAGAALALLDARVRGDLPFGGAWRRRLALKAAAASARLVRRGEDEAMLRDAFFLRHSSADPGPAGRMLLAWRSLECSTPLDEDAIVRAGELFGLPIDAVMRSAIAGVQEVAHSDRCAPVAAAAAASLIVAAKPGAELLALWVADAVLAKRLNWPLPLPLIAAAVLRRSPHSEGRRPQAIAANWSAACSAAYARAAVAACDLFAELERSSQKLRNAAPRLRAKGAAAVIATLHSEDAVPASGRIAAMSDRALRRLFDRLVALGAVRELTARPTFRLYGL
jgi:hypothetical protein